MKKRWLGLIAVLLGVGLILGGFPTVYAQEEDKDTFTLDEIIVTAERRETNAQDTPVAVTAFDNTMLDEQGIDGIQDLQMRMPSTTITANKVYIRGVGRELNQLGVDPGVGIYTDGFYTTEQGALSDSFDVARIESLRGPQSTLFGRNTIGGAVQVLYNRPTKEFSGQAKLRLHNFSEKGYTAYLALGGPLYGDKLLGRIRVIGFDTDGPLKNVTTGNWLGGSAGETVNVMLTWAPTDRFENYSRYWFSTYQGPAVRSSIIPDPYPTADDASNQAGEMFLHPRGQLIWKDEFGKWVPAMLPYELGNHTATNPSVDDRWKIALNDDGFNDFDGMGIQNTTTFEATQDLTVKLLLDYRDWWWYLDADGDRSASPYKFTWRVPMEIYGGSAELQVIYGGPDTRWAFIGGLYYYFKHEVQGYNWRASGLFLENPDGSPGLMATPDYTVTGDPDPLLQIYTPWPANNSELFFYDTTIETTDKAIYGQVDFELTDTLNLTLGARYAIDEKKGQEFLYFISQTPLRADYDTPGDNGAPGDGVPDIGVGMLAQLAAFGITGYEAGDFVPLLPQWAVDLGYAPSRDAMYAWWGVRDDAVGYWWRYLLDQTLSKDWDALIGKASIDWKPLEGTLLYLSYSRGYKAGGFRLGSWDEDPIFEPEFLNSYEAGWKQLLFGDRWRVNITAFLYDYQDMQLFQRTNENTQIINAGDSDVYGVEIEWDGYITDRLRVNGAYGWIIAEYQDITTVDVSQPWLGEMSVKGNKMKRIPEHKVGVSATYTQPTDIGDFSLNAHYAWQGETFFRMENSWKDRAEPWDRVDARLWWSSPDYKWRVAVYANNITKSEGVFDITVQGPARGGQRNWSMMDPLSYGLEIAYRF